MQNMQVIKPEDIIEIILRRRWYIIISFCLSMIFGIFLVLMLPKIYKAETLVLLQSERVADNYVQPITNADIKKRISTISQQVLSRSNLETIITEFKLYSDLKSKDMLLEEKIAKSRKRITVNVKKSGDYSEDIESFVISFKGPEPETVMNVTNALARNFINQNLKTKENQTTSTTQIIEKELSVLEKRLKESEKTLNDFRAQNLEGLPEQLEANLNKIDRLSDQLISKRERLQIEKDSLNTMENGISGTGGGGEPDTYDTLSLNQLVTQLKQLKTRYTDQHPDIIRLEKRIADLENEAEIPQGNTQSINIKREIKILEGEIADLMKQISFYEDLLSDTPKREQELKTLKDNYESIFDTYNSYLARKQEAEFAVNMEKTKQMEQFHILDHAKLPEKHSEPDMVMLFLIIIAAGIGVGGGLSYVLEFLDTSIRKTADIEISLGLPVLSTIPAIYQPKDIRKKRFNQILSVSSIIVSSFLFISFSMLVFIGEDRTVGLVKKVISI